MFSGCISLSQLPNLFDWNKIIGKKNIFEKCINCLII